MSNFEDYYHSIAKSSSVDSKGKAVFYSGEGNYQRAMDYAKKTGAVPIDRTPAGKQLNGIYKKAHEHYGNEFQGSQAADTVMRTASERYAKNARGHVDTFVVGAKPNRVFLTTELPVLLNNNKVKSINGIDRNFIKKLHDRHPNQAFDRICRAELIRDLKTRDRTDKNASADLKKRIESYRNSKPANDNRQPKPKEIKKLNRMGDTANRQSALLRDRNRLNQKGDRTKPKPAKDLRKARVKLKKPGENSKKNNTNERFKARYGKQKDTKFNLSKASREKSKLTPKVAQKSESRGLKKAGTTEKMTSLRKQGRDRNQRRDKAIKSARAKKPSEPRTKGDNIKSRYGKPSDSNRGKRGEAQSKKPSETKQPRTSSTPKTDSRPKPSGDTKPKGGGGGTSRRR